MTIDWNSLKSERLKHTRGISFEEIINEELVAVLKHPVRHDQQILIYEIEGYCWAVPCVMEEDRIFLKTIYPSHKLTKKYKNKEL